MKKVYVCPMHPEVRQDRPGMCPECGMALTRTNTDRHADKRRQNHDKHAGHSTAQFARKFWVSLVLTIPIVYLRFVEFPNSGYISLLLGSAVFFYGGWVFLRGAGLEIKGRLPGMMTLISIAILAAYLWSVYAVFVAAEALFWELTTLITVMLLGHFLEMRAVQGAQGALKELSKLLPDTAEVIIGGGEREGVKTVQLAELKIGDLVLVKPGGKIPTDGEVMEGQSEVNEAMITGESKLISKKRGDQVIAGTINGDGSLQIRITKIGEHTFLAGVMRLVREAQASKSRLQILADRAAFYLTVIAIISGALTFILWLVAKATPSFALERLVAVLVIACPHALGLAVPLVASISTTMAAKRGFIVKQRLALEQARKIDVVLFDKTGTLTKGEHAVVSIVPNLTLSPSPISERAGGEVASMEILKLAAALESHSEHIIGKAIVRKAREESLEIPEVKEFRALPGRGVQGMVEGKKVMVGGPQLLEELGIRSQELGKEKDKTIIYVIVDGGLAGSIALADEVREESRQAVKELKNLGIKVAMVTGDAEAVAKSVAQELGIEDYRAQVLPEEKVKIVKEFQNNAPHPPLKVRGGEGGVMKVAFVGDGINDAPALAQADLGIAIGAGTNVAIESAGIILVKNDPRDIPKIIRLSKLTYAKMMQNLWWATGYNIVALPLAAGVLAAKGIILEPALAALFMSLSTVIVALNALLLRRREL